VKAMMDDRNLQCITDHEGFEPTTLNVHVLDTQKVTLLQYIQEEHKREKLKKGDNDSYRFLAYHSFRKWVTKGKKLGKGRRLQTPPCVVRLIRQKWPTQSGIYTGFVSTLNSIDTL
jgi:FAD synthase